MAILQISITKGKGTVDIDTEKLPEDVFREAMIQGLKTLANRGMSKITKAEIPNAEKLVASAMAKAKENVDAIYEGKIRFTGGAKKAGVSGAVKTEAMKLAKGLVKDQMKRDGIKISHVEATTITQAARELLEASPQLLEMAKQAIEERQKLATSGGINLSAIKISTSAKKVAAAEGKAKKAKAAAPKKAKAGTPAHA